MKRKEAVKKLELILKDWENCKLDRKAAGQILKRIEKEIGMHPPYVPPEMANALICVYMDPNYNLWEDDVLKDKEVVKKMKTRAESASKREARRVK